MAEIVRLPKMSDQMTHGSITRWHKDIGDPIREGDTLAEVDTEKATLELEAYTEGVMLYRVPEGEVRVDLMICIVGEAGEDINALIQLDEKEGAFLAEQAQSIRTFIGAKDYELSRKFYQELGFVEAELSPEMCYFHAGRFGFYLQKYYVKDWVDNSMVFMEVADAQATYVHLQSLALHQRFEGVRLLSIKEETWGRECFLHDPSGVLWHFGEFYD